MKQATKVEKSTRQLQNIFTGQTKKKKLAYTKAKGMKNSFILMDYRPQRMGTYMSIHVHNLSLNLGFYDSDFADTVLFHQKFCLTGCHHC